MTTYAANAAASAQADAVGRAGPEHQPRRHGSASCRGEQRCQQQCVELRAQRAAQQPAGGFECGRHTGAPPRLLLRSAASTARCRHLFGAPFISNSINTINVTGSWFLFIGMSAIPLLTHFVAGAPFGFTMGDATPLGAGLGFGTTLAGATSGPAAPGRWPAWARRLRSAGCRCRPVGLRPLRGAAAETTLGGHGLDRSRRRGGHWHGRRRHERRHAGNGCRRRQVRNGHRRTALRRQAEGLSEAGIRLMTGRGTVPPA